MPTPFDPFVHQTYLPDWKIQDMLDAMAARPPRQITYRKVAIFLPADITPAAIEHAQSAVRSCFRLASTGWSVLLPDTYAALQVVAVCEIFEVGYTVIGTAARAASGISMRHYERVLCAYRTEADRRLKRDSAMLRRADAVLCNGRADIAWIAGRMGKRALGLEELAA